MLRLLDSSCRSGTLLHSAILWLVPVAAALLLGLNPAVVAGEKLESQRYVAATGSDAADGSSARPWHTLQHAADRVNAGTTVHVRAGRYAGFQLTRSGMQDRPITFHAEKGAVIDTPHPGEDGINLEGACYVVIEGFEV
ncbi:MAG TPA: hypothetical protein VGH74_22130, partial [Planctomycetaceae bacterium]